MSKFKVGQKVMCDTSDSGAIGGIILTILLIGSGMMVVGIYITNVIIVLLG